MILLFKRTFVYIWFLGMFSCVQTSDLGVGRSTPAPLLRSPYVFCDTQVKEFEFESVNLKSTQQNRIISTTMDRLDGSARLMIVSDLDLTMVDHDDGENLSLLRFNALWEAHYRQDSLLVFSTGRSPTIYKQLRKEKPLLTPDITIMSVGTEIVYGESMVHDDGWENYLNHKWDRGIVLEETAKFPELAFQSETEQRPHKISFFVEKFKAFAIMKALSERLEERGVLEKDRLLHMCLKNSKLMAKYRLILLFVVTLEMMPNYSAFLTYMVSNSQEELLQWHAENAKDNPKIIHATERCAAGIMQAIGKFGLGPNVSPRDIRDFQKCKVGIFSPGHEVVKLYLFYERWRRAEVEKSEHYMQSLRSVFYSLGIIVHPSGTEQSMHQCSDLMENLYGDKQGKQYRVWVDRVSSAQIGLDAWLVKFDKWESSGEERQCCLTTVLMSSQNMASDEYKWMHVHQTWLEGSESKSIWIL